MYELPRAPTILLRGLAFSYGRAVVLRSGDRNRRRRIWPGDARKRWGARDWRNSAPFLFNQEEELLKLVRRVKYSDATECKGECRTGMQVRCDSDLDTTLSCHSYTRPPVPPSLVL